MHAKPQQKYIIPCNFRIGFERAEHIMALLKEYIGSAVIMTLLFTFSAPPVTFGQEEELVLDNPDAYVEKHRPEVIFPHDLHMGEFDCLDCHHDYDEDGENVLDEDTLEEGNEDILCTACHDVCLRELYHKQCMGCHRDFRIAGDATGPELCGECHIRK